MLTYHLKFVFGSKSFDSDFATLDALAMAVYRLRYSDGWHCAAEKHLLAGIFPVYVHTGPLSALVVFDVKVSISVANGTSKPLRVDELFRHGANLASAYRQHYRGNRKFWNGEGPVPGTGKISGHYAWFRRIGTTQERRMNQSIDPDEPLARARRRGCNLPSAWDDVCRGGSNSWKDQRRGRKAWDRYRGTSNARH